MENRQDAITIFRTWVDLAGEMRSDADRGRFYHAICRYAMDGEEPRLTGLLRTYFELIKPIIDKSNARRKAQQNSVQTRLQNGLQNGLQNTAQPAAKPTGNPNGKPARKTVCHKQEKEQEQEKKTPPDGGAKEKAFSFAIPLPLPPEIDTPEIREAWARWLEYRRAKRKPVSKAAAEIAFRLWKEFPDKAVEIIDYSIMQDYQGLFPPKNRPVVLHPAKPEKKDYSAI